MTYTLLTYAPIENNHEELLFQSTVNSEHIHVAQRVAANILRDPDIGANQVTITDENGIFISRLHTTTVQL